MRTFHGANSEHRQSTLDDSSSILGPSQPEWLKTALKSGLKPNRPPSAGFQFFGILRAHASSRVLTAELFDLSGKRLYSVDLSPGQ